jgi:hypothetical protein
MPLIDAPLGELRMEKSIVIDANRAKQMEARGEILKSDDFVERDRGENLAPAQFVQEVVDANTAARLAAARGITLASSVDQAAGVSFGTGAPVGTGANPAGHSKMPAAILESFRKQPPIVPQMQTQSMEFDPAFVASVQEANRRLNKAGGDIAARIPRNATQQTLNEGRPTAPATNMYSQIQQAPQQYYTQPQAPSVGVDYSVMAAIIKEAVREAMKEINLKDIVKEVLKEEREGVAKQTINENIQIKIGNSIFAGKINSVQAPQKK